MQANASSRSRRNAMASKIKGPSRTINFLSQHEHIGEHVNYTLHQCESDLLFRRFYNQ